MENISVAGGWDREEAHRMVWDPGESQGRRGEWSDQAETRGDARPVSWEERVPVTRPSGHWGMVPSLKLGPGPVKWRVPPLLPVLTPSDTQWYTIRQTDPRRSRPSTVQRATSSLITSPLQSPESGILWPSPQLFRTISTKTTGSMETPQNLDPTGLY